MNNRQIRQRRQARGSMRRHPSPSKRRRRPEPRYPAQHNNQGLQSRVPCEGTVDTCGRVKE